MQTLEEKKSIQPLFNHYKSITYMCAYFPKSEDDTSEATREALNGNTSDCKKMKTIAKASITKRGCLDQKEIDLVIPELLQIILCIVIY